MPGLYPLVQKRWVGPRSPRNASRRLADESLSVQQQLGFANGSAEGFGILMQHSAMVTEDVAQGRLVELLADHCPPPRPLHLVYPKDRLPVPKLSRFVEFALTQFGGGE